MCKKYKAAERGGCVLAKNMRKSLRCIVRTAKQGSCNQRVDNLMSVTLLNFKMVIFVPISPFLYTKQKYYNISDVNRENINPCL